MDISWTYSPGCDCLIDITGVLTHLFSERTKMYVLPNTNFEKQQASSIRTQNVNSRCFVSSVPVSTLSDDPMSSSQNGSRWRCRIRCVSQNNIKISVFRFQTRVNDLDLWFWQTTPKWHELNKIALVVEFLTYTVCRINK